MGSMCRTGAPPQIDQTRQRMLHVVASAAGRIGHDLLGLTVPLRAVLEALAADGADISIGPEACRQIERFGAGLQMLAATERTSMTADPGAVYHTMEPLLRATLPRGVQLVAEFGEPAQLDAGREAVGQAMFRCLHTVAASAAPGDRLVVRSGLSSEEDALDLRFSLEPSGAERPATTSPASDLLPRHDDPLTVALGAMIEAQAGEAGPIIVLTIPLMS